SHRRRRALRRSPTHQYPPRPRRARPYEAAAVTGERPRPVRNLTGGGPTVQCPRCDVTLVATIRYKLPVNFCQSCKGMWLEQPELQELEDEVFDFGDRWKGTLIFTSTASTDKCPECAAPLQRFKYRFYDLEMEHCPNEHGYWLEADEDTRVLE